MSDKINTTLLLTLAFVLLFFSIQFLYSQSSKVYNNVFLDGSETGTANNNYEPQVSSSYKSIQPLKTN